MLIGLVLFALFGAGIALLSYVLQVFGGHTLGVGVEAGLAALALCLLAGYGLASFAVGLMGLLAVVGGYVVLLRRRDYRALRSRYGDPDSLSDDKF